MQAPEYSNLDPSPFSSAPAASQDLVCQVTLDGRVFLRSAQDHWELPVVGDLPPTTRPGPENRYRWMDAGRLGSARLLAMLVEGDSPPGLQAVSLRRLVLEDNAVWRVVARVQQVLFWLRRHRFCGVCGAELAPGDVERHLRCPVCGNVEYPMAASATITAILRGDQILLARNISRRHPFYSLVAGFLEPGETLEQCVVREVREEVGLHVSQPHYLFSQPWPFPSTLMAGFAVRSESGDVAVDGVEIGDAGWFTADELPEVPPPGTIARRIIDGWIVGELPL